MISRSILPRYFVESCSDSTLLSTYTRPRHQYGAYPAPIRKPAILYTIILITLDGVLISGSTPEIQEAFSVSLRRQIFPDETAAKVDD